MTQGRRAVWSWALYDWANSAFATTVIAGFFPIFFQEYWSGQFADSTTTLQLGVGSAAASFTIMLLAPILGATADTGGFKKVLLATFVVLGVVATAALFWVPQGAWFSAITLFALASVGFAGSLVFYDGLILAVAPAGQLDRVSALGYGLGYLGGGLLLVLNVAMTLWPEAFGLADKSAAVRWSFLSVALWWALFSLPLLLFVGERRPAPRPAFGTALVRGLRELRRTAAHVRSVRAAALFLLAYWLYIDGVHTIIRMAVNFGVSLGFPSTSLIVALLLVQFIGFPAAIAFGWLGQRWGPRRGIYIALAVYAAVTVGGFFMTTVVQFYVMAAVIGLVQGGIQSLSRSYFARLVPEGKSGEFFGFYNMLGKFAAVIGPLLVGITAALTENARLSILAVLLLFAAGAWVLTRVPAPERA